MNQVIEFGNDVKILDRRIIQKVHFNNGTVTYGDIDLLSCPIGGMFFKFRDIYGRERLVNGSTILHVEEMQGISLHDYCKPEVPRWYAFDMTDKIVTELKRYGQTPEYSDNYIRYWFN